MSAQEMCIVPTPDGDVEVPVGTVIEVGGVDLLYADEGGFQAFSDRVGDGDPHPYDDLAATIVAIPDENGCWTVPGATTPEPQWVALTEEQVALLPDRTPVRVEEGGTAIEGLFHREGTDDRTVYLHHDDGGYRYVGSLARVTVHVHPDDVPDPDADLIERAAREIEKVISTSARWSDYQQAARDIITLVRGEQA